MRLKETGQKTELAKLRAEHAEQAKAITAMQRRAVQAQHEIRRKEHDYDRLQQRLRDLLTEKARFPDSTSLQAKHMKLVDDHPNAFSFICKVVGAKGM